MSADPHSMDESPSVEQRSERYLSDPPPTREELRSASCCLSEKRGRRFFGSSQFTSEQALDEALAEARLALPEQQSAYVPTGQTTAASQLSMLLASPVLFLLMLAVCGLVLAGYYLLATAIFPEGEMEGGDSRVLGLISIVTDLILVALIVFPLAYSFGMMSKWLKNREPLFPSWLAAGTAFLLGLALFCPNPLLDGETLAPTDLMFIVIPVRWLLIGLSVTLVPLMAGALTHYTIASQKFCEETGLYLRPMRDLTLSFDCLENALELAGQGHITDLVKLPLSDDDTHCGHLRLWWHQAAETGYLEIEARYHGRVRPDKFLTVEGKKEKKSSWLMLSEKLDRSQADAVFRGYPLAREGETADARHEGQVAEQGMEQAVVLAEAVSLRKPRTVRKTRRALVLGGAFAMLFLLLSVWILLESARRPGATGRSPRTLTSQENSLQQRLDHERAQRDAAAQRMATMRAEHEQMTQRAGQGSRVIEETRQRIGSGARQAQADSQRLFQQLKQDREQIERALRRDIVEPEPKPSPSHAPEKPPQEEIAGKQTDDDRVKIEAQYGSTPVFEHVPAGTHAPARARVHLPEHLSLAQIRISGQGHNQDRHGFPRTMKVKINDREFEVLPWIDGDGTKPFTLSVPSDVLKHGWNDIDAFIWWSDGTSDGGHWVSVALIVDRPEVPGGPDQQLANDVAAATPTETKPAEPAPAVKPDPPSETTPAAEPVQPTGPVSAAKPSGTKPEGSGESPGPVEIVARTGATVIFSKASGNKSQPASARIQIPDDVSFSKARISGEGHNQDRVGFPRTMEVKINGRVIKVIPLLGQGQTKSFDTTVPPGLLTSGWNEIQAYIEWSNKDYDRGHWVSLTLTLE